jgi:endonuclease/exonuclease/phosphatase (EEP) superfamily protein YafD
VTITYNNRNIDFALIHTSAPVSQHFFTMRNQQLDNLSQLLNTYYTSDSQKNIILLGDFNLSPWSYYYKLFEQSMDNIGLIDYSNNMKNTMYNGMYLPYTRCHEQAPYLCSHIDHIRSNNVNISLEKINIP